MRTWTDSSGSVYCLMTRSNRGPPAVQMGFDIPSACLSVCMHAFMYIRMDGRTDVCLTSA
jgi:hypothetical protein